MKITFYHHVQLPIKTYGGTERILFWHMKELVRLGHDVTLLGHKDSTVEGFGIKLIALPSEILRNGWQKLIPSDTDILHLQHNRSYETPVPTICTIHGNGQLQESFDLNSVFVSNSHGKNHGSDVFIHNALDFSEYPCPSNIKNKGKDELLFLGKVSWRIKNIKDSKKVAIGNKKHLHIVGGKSFSLSRYIHNHGLLGGEKKMDLIRKCDALIFPVRWQEPFGLAMIEAMSQGLPVFGSQHGSLPEVIGPAGKSCQSYKELNDAISDFSCSLKAQEIRDYCISNFSINDYSKKYLLLYEKVIGKESLNKTNPMYISDKRAETLLPF